MDRGGQPGNQNAARGRVWRQAIERALDTRGRADRVAALDALAEKLLTKCDEGDISALRELGDRLEGKCAQPIVGDEDSPPMRVQGVVEFVRRAADAKG